MPKLTAIGLGQYSFELSRDLRQIVDAINKINEKLGLLSDDDISRLQQIGSASVVKHSTTHKPGGTDALATAAPVDVTLSANAEGTSTSFARSDHKHDLAEDIAPTWSAAHIFENKVTLTNVALPITLEVDGVTQLDGATTVNNTFQVNGTVGATGAVTFTNAVLSVANLPSGAGIQPGSVSAGELWHDSTDNTVKLGV